MKYILTRTVGLSETWLHRRSSVGTSAALLSSHPEHLDLIGKAHSHLVCSFNFPHWTLFNPLTLGAAAQNLTHDLSVTTHNELFLFSTSFHSWLISGVHLCRCLPKFWSSWRKATTDVWVYGLLLIWLKILGLQCNRKLSVFISITAADDKTQIRPWHWLHC